MGRLELDLVQIEVEIETHLNNAQASLDAQQEKYARRGLLSAAIVKTLANLALTYGKFTEAHERSRFQVYLNQSAWLERAYWEDFKLVFIKRTEHPMVQAKEDPPSTRPGLPRPPQTGLSIRKGSKLSVEQRSAIIDLLRDGHPDDITNRAWYGLIAQEYGISAEWVRVLSKKYLNGD